MNDSSEVAKKLAEQFAGNALESLTPKPTPKPPMQTHGQAYMARTSTPRSHPPVPPPRKPHVFGAGMGETVKVGAYELRRKPLWPNDIAALDDKAKAMPKRDPVELTAMDWEALAETPVRRDMDFDAWMRECCLPELVKDYDGDYAAAARLFIQKKREAHGTK